MPKKVKFLILGAGPCGLGAAYKLNDLGQTDYLLLEKSHKVGGLATSYVDDKGFTWDVGGHVQFSHYEYFDKAMHEALGDKGWLHHQREAWVWIKNRFVPYPFQNNIHRLPKEDCESALSGLEQRETPAGGLKTFKDWLLSSFGKDLCEIFMYPYNLKVWAYPTEQLNYKWIGERVAQIDLDRIKDNIKHQKDDVSWGPNNTFQFPVKGGTGAIWSSIGNIIDPEKTILNSSITSIDYKNKIVKADNEEYEYEHILSTLPLTTLSDLVGDNKLIDLSSKLKSSSIHVVGIGLEGELPESLVNKCWMYFPESDSPFYRVTVFSNYSPNNVPDSKKHFSLMAEISESELKKVDRENIVEETIQGLVNCKLIKDEKIISRWSLFANLGYPTPSINRDEILEQVFKSLDEKGINSRGRFGAWKYEISNQDHTFMQGAEWVSNVLEGASEPTFKGVLAS
ncbi:MAG: protoporphyrinogen oxidase [Halieaceae bacterium]|jgi:protoporphyrinogen oxidase